jgi:hypothetical protein
VIVTNASEAPEDQVKATAQRTTKDQKSESLIPAARDEMCQIRICPFVFVSLRKDLKGKNSSLFTFC